MKKSVHYRYKNSWIDLCGDGMFPEERLKGEQKKDFKKKTRLRLKKEAAIDILDDLD